MKVGIYIVTYNKNEYLPNTLYSIARQKTSFNYEVCVADDCSDEDPEPIVKRFFPEAKYLRAEKHIGFMGSFRDGYKVVPEDIEILIMQSDDVIHLSMNSIEILCNLVKPKTMVFATVRNAKVPVSDWKNDLAISRRIKRKHLRGGPGKWNFFLGASLKEDMDYIGLGKDILCDCDAHRRDKMIKAGYTAIYPNLHGLHQIHPVYFSPCPLAEGCNYKCKARK